MMLPYPNTISPFLAGNGDPSNPTIGGWPTSAPIYGSPTDPYLGGNPTIGGWPTSPPIYGSTDPYLGGPTAPAIGGWPTSPPILGPTDPYMGGYGNPGGLSSPQRAASLISGQVQGSADDWYRRRLLQQQMNGG